jgi:hypothetical protein
MFCLNQFNTFIKTSNFEFGYYCVCNEKKFTHELILYINSVSLSVCPSVEVLKPRSLLIKLCPRTRGPKNYSGPRVLTSYFYFYVSFHIATAGGPYFLLLLLRPFPRSNCRRRWGRYFWDLEGG